VLVAFLALTMELKSLSSNWKKLQKELKSSSSKKPDQKAEHTESDNHQSSASKLLHRNDPRRGNSEANSIVLGKRRRFSETKTHREPTNIHYAAKRRRLASLEQTTSSKTKLNGKMGSYLSTPSSRDQEVEGKDGADIEDNGKSKTRNSNDKRRTSSSLALWAEDNDIAAEDLAEAYPGLDLKGTTTPNSLRLGVKHAGDIVNEGLSSTADLGQYIALDCEMVGVDGKDDRSILARASVVNFHGIQIYDSYVLPPDKVQVTNWRTAVSGISPASMVHARPFSVVQEQVAEIMEGRVLIGHALRNDLEVLLLGHPRKDIRDTSRHPDFKKLAGGRTPSLKKLVLELLGVEIQGGEHSSVEDARACMLLFRKHKGAFEAEHAKNFRGLVRREREEKEKEKAKEKKRDQGKGNKKKTKKSRK
jgi:RNA exonuclease 4